MCQAQSFLINVSSTARALLSCYTIQCTCVYTHTHTHTHTHIHTQNHAHDAQPAFSAWEPRLRGGGGVATSRDVLANTLQGITTGTGPVRVCLCLFVCGCVCVCV